MKSFFASLCLILVLFACQNSGPGIPGLKAEVEIIRDQWGINHIYAQNQHDLFFAQGYAAAKDRLFQFEIWRRQATGTVAEILGPDELNRDIGTRLFKFRGDMKTEMNHYHPDGEEIITAYTDGVNAYIDEVLANPEMLPVEFELLGIKPGKWTPEVVISRHQGLLGNIGLELQIGRAVAKLGAKKVQELNWFHPKKPKLELDEAIDGELLFDNILMLYNAYRRPVRFKKEQLSPEYANHQVAQELLAFNDLQDDPDFSVGSNNWVVSGALTEDGNTYMANDPHRTIAVPSLRYMAHLVAPGWNVIGGGEPEIPGISIGHNEDGAWGLTVFRTDAEDLYVYDLNPDNPNQYRYQDKWEDMTLIEEAIAVKGQQNHTVTLRYTRHGPVTHVDLVNHKAYAVRCGWLEPGGSPYLASLRMDQAKTWEEFREACNFSHIPGENMIWADKEGNIGWQAVGIAPIRRNWSGMVPVPGDGRYEWDGYLPIIEKPNVTNPEAGFFATANQNVTPEDYDQWDAIGFNWSDPYRGDRVNEVLSKGKKLNMEDMKALQMDYTSLPARTLVPLLDKMRFQDEMGAAAHEKLQNWNYELSPGSVAATIYVAWESEIKLAANQRWIPEEGRRYLGGLQMKKVIDWLTTDLNFPAPAEEYRNDFLLFSFVKALDKLEKRLGPDMDQWQYGQAKNKHSQMNHALGHLVNDSLKALMNLGPLPRGGNGYTPGATGNNLRQSHGASFRMIINTGNWDAAIGTNSPGQSGDPTSPFYRNLFESWAKDEFFPMYYSQEKIEANQAERVLLKPGK